MPNVSPSSGASSFTATETSAKSYGRSQSLPAVQPSVHPVLEMANTLSDQSALAQQAVEPSLLGTNTNTGTNCLFDRNSTPFQIVESSLGVYVPVALKKKIWNNDYVALNNC